MSEDYKLFAGSGGDEEQGSSASMRERDDTLASKQYLKIVDLLSEGQIAGLDKGLQSILIAGTPLQNVDGTYNSKGFIIEGRNGTQTQTAIDGYSQVESSKSVGVQLKKGFPVIRTVESPDAKKARVSISLPSLKYTDVISGETGPTSVAFSIATRGNGGAWQEQAYYDEPLGQGSMAEFFVQESPTSIRSIKRPDSVNLCVKYTSTANSTKNHCEYKVEATVTGQTNWYTVFTGVFDVFAILPTSKSSLYAPAPQITPSITNHFHTFAMPAGVTYDFRVSITSSNGFVGSIELPVASCTGTSRRNYGVISGKASDNYVKDFVVPLSGTPPFDIKVERLSDDSTSQYLNNDTYFSSYTEIIPYRYSYPNSALVAMTIDASLYSDVPERAYDVRGLVVRVPNNYDPVTRTYTGIWDGATYKLAWTDNPAWLLLDILTSTRYGLGNKLNISQIDVAKLYEISMYCDEYVNDGYGGVEPRYTCSMYIQGKTKAMTLINDIASVFQGYPYWAGGKLSFNYDHEADPEWLFTNANVIDGSFEYEGSDKSTRYNVARITYTDRRDSFTQKVEYVEDRDGILKYGTTPIETTAVGCMSRGQAHRLGKNILLSSRYLTETVTFKAGIEANAAYILPGTVISISDSLRSGRRLSGRLLSATSSEVVLDSIVDITVGSWTLTVISPNGEMMETAVSSALPTDTLSVLLASVPQTMSVWILQSSSVQAQLFRVTSIKEDSPSEYTISAVAYNPSKYAAIESDLLFTPLDVSGASTSSIESPKNLVLSEELYFDASRNLLSRVNLSVRQSTNPYFKEYFGKWRYVGGNWTNIEAFNTQETVIQPVKEGVIEVAIQARNSLGVVSPTTFAEITILGKTAPPSDVTGFGASVNKGTAFLTWDAFTLNSDLDVSYFVVKHTTSANPSWANSVVIADKIASPATSCVVPAKPGTYLIKAVDSSGNYSLNPALIFNTISNLESFNVIEQMVEEPDWLDTKVNTSVYNGRLVISGSTISIWDPLSIAQPLATRLGHTSVGTYTTSVFDLGDVFTSRLTFDLEAFGFQTNNYMSRWASLTQVESLAGGTASQFGVDVFYKIANDPSGPWSDWISTFSGEVTFRCIQFKLQLTSYEPNVTPAVEVFHANIDMPDRVDGKEDVSSPAAGVSVVYAPAFLSNPAVAIVAQGMATGDYYTISGKTKEGFTIRFYNSSNVAVARTFDWVAKGYGYKYE